MKRTLHMTNNRSKSERYTQLADIQKEVPA